MTIASSTNIPMTMIIPKREMTLMVIKLGAKMNKPKKEKGNPTATQKAILGFKKSERKSKTKRIPIAPFSINRFWRSNSGMDKSALVFSWTLLLLALNFSTYSFTWSVANKKSSLLVVTDGNLYGTFPIKVDSIGYFRPFIPAPLQGL